MGDGQSLQRLAEIPVQEVKRIGDKRAESLAALGITSVLDLITHYPRRYIDRSRQADVVGMAVGEESLVLARVESVKSRRTRNGRALVELEVDDGTGTLRVTFFNQAWRAKQLPVGTEALFFGKLDTYRGKRQFTNPVVDLVGNRTGRIVPIYPTGGNTGNGSVRHCAGPANSPILYRDGGAASSGSWTGRRRSGPSTLRKPSTRRAKPGDGWRSTNSCGCSWRS